MKKVINILIWAVLLVGLFILLEYLKKEYSQTKCKGIEISISYPNSNCFITKKDISSQIHQIYNSIEKKSISDINIEMIEKKIKKDPYIAEVNVHSTINGNIKINVVQREPIVKIINNKSQSFYIGKEGSLIPLNHKHPARVLIANGKIKQAYSPKINYNIDKKNKADSSIRKSTSYKIYLLAKYINSNKFLNSQIEQIYVNPITNEFELIPSVGRHIIEFGDIDNMKVKFDKLIIFYKKGLRKIGWNKYKIINLKYKNQVVCSKI